METTNGSFSVSAPPAKSVQHTELQFEVISQCIVSVDDWDSYRSVKQSKVLLEEMTPPRGHGTSAGIMGMPVSVHVIPI